MIPRRDFTKGRVTGPERRALNVVLGVFRGELPEAVAAVARHAAHDRSQVEIDFVCAHTAGTVYVPYRSFAELWWDAPVRTKRQREARRKALSDLVLGAVARDHARKHIVSYRGSHPEFPTVELM